jgi:Icc-related predicted phosphoesterase
MTRILVISDTHGTTPYGVGDLEHAFRWPLPQADILLHCGDLTRDGALAQHERTVEMIKKAPAKLKIVIPGDHDISLDEKYYERDWKLHSTVPKQDTDACRALYTNIEAQEAGLVYMEEGKQTFNVNGVKFTVYASAYTPEFGKWGFAYERDEDRFNLSSTNPSQRPVNPVPDHGEVDIMITHGPPLGLLDKTKQGIQVGCKHLAQAVLRCKPRLHAFGHVHEAWGALKMNWDSLAYSVFMVPEKVQLRRNGGVRAIVSKEGGTPLKFGKETLFVNASIMDLLYDPYNAPFVVDIDLPLAEP